MKSVGILVVAFNASTTLANVLDRIPEKFVPRISQILVSDDASSDDTFDVGQAYAELNPQLGITTVRQPRNLGYGGNQKFGYQWAMDHGLDIVVLLHGDGQYAPEMLPAMIAPLDADEADCVMGSRMLIRGAARRGGMPLYKYVGNKILTRFENTVVGTNLSEWHSGYRAYRVDALQDLPLERNSDGFGFDTEVIVQLVEAQKRITEIAIPTYYGDEISHVNGLGYAWDISRHVLRYRMHKVGFGEGDLAFNSDDYGIKSETGSSHSQIARLVAGAPKTILDLGCGRGHLGALLADAGHHVTGIDVIEQSMVSDRVHRYVKADLSQDLPADLGTFDAIVAADVVEHLAQPEQLLRQLSDHLVPDGVLIVSVPNFAHWYPRARVATGRFGYDRRGILDETHLRFFTRRSFQRLALAAGWRAEVIGTTRASTSLLRTSNVRDARSDTNTPSTKRIGRPRRPNRDSLPWTRRRPAILTYQYLFQLTPLMPNVNSQVRGEPSRPTADS
jgi:2-polyprenyl-3-methyl-5-hydroxy-6-metoxy-1,4-benzoquinol methylase